MIAIDFESVTASMGQITKVFSEQEMTFSSVKEKVFFLVSNNLTISPNENTVNL